MDSKGNVTSDFRLPSSYYQIRLSNEDERRLFLLKQNNDVGREQCSTVRTARTADDQPMDSSSPPVEVINLEDEDTEDDVTEYDQDDHETISLKDSEEDDDDDDASKYNRETINLEDTEEDFGQVDQNCTVTSNTDFENKPAYVLPEKFGRLSLALQYSSIKFHPYRSMMKAMDKHWDKKPNEIHALSKNMMSELPIFKNATPFPSENWQNFKPKRIRIKTNTEGCSKATANCVGKNVSTSDHQKMKKNNFKFGNQRIIDNHCARWDLNSSSVNVPNIQKPPQAQQYPTTTNSVVNNAQTSEYHQAIKNDSEVGENIQQFIRREHKQILIQDEKIQPSIHLDDFDSKNFDYNSPDIYGANIQKPRQEIPYAYPDSASVVDPSRKQQSSFVPEWQPFNPYHGHQKYDGDQQKNLQPFDPRTVGHYYDNNHDDSSYMSCASSNVNEPYWDVYNHFDHPDNVSSLASNNNDLNDESDARLLELEFLIRRRGFDFSEMAFPDPHAEQINPFDYQQDLWNSFNTP